MFKFTINDIGPWEHELLNFWHIYNTLVPPYVIYSCYSLALGSLGKNDRHITQRRYYCVNCNTRCSGIRIPWKKCCWHRYPKLTCTFFIMASNSITATFYEWWLIPVWILYCVMSLMNCFWDRKLFSNVPAS